MIATAFIAPLLSLFLLVILAAIILLVLSIAVVIYWTRDKSNVQDIDRMPEGNLSVGAAALFTILGVIGISIVLGVGSSILRVFLYQ